MVKPIDERKPRSRRAAISRPLAFATDAARFASALVRDSIAVGRAARAVPDGAGTRAGEVVAGRLAGIARKVERDGPLVPESEGTITLEAGLTGSRGGRPGRRQVTVLTREGWDAACAQLGCELDWSARRANLLVEGLDLARRSGSLLTIGEVVLEITGETTPCSRMDAESAGLRVALLPDWRAGVTCRVRCGGRIRIGDRVTLESAPPQGAT